MDKGGLYNPNKHNKSTKEIILLGWIISNMETIIDACACLHGSLFLYEKQFQMTTFVYNCNTLFYPKPLPIITNVWL